MLEMIRARYASRPRVSASSASQVLAAPVDSFTVVNFRFERDGNAATQVDTAHIQAGQSIRFKFGTGFHTATSGTGSSDPDAGGLFDNPLTSPADQFDFQFDDPGLVHFFCRIHEGLNMKGVVVVAATSGVPSASPIGPRLGFVTALMPNPSSRGVAFRFAMIEPGRARLEVFDAQGRRVATPLDRDFPAGEHAGSWDGAGAGGAHVRPGVYSLRLTVPGATQVRQVSEIR
jgi:plastocyanin